MRARTIFTAAVGTLAAFLMITACAPAAAPAPAPTAAVAAPTTAPAEAATTVPTEAAAAATEPAAAPTTAAAAGTPITLKFFSQCYNWAGKVYPNIGTEPLAEGDYEKALIETFKKDHPNVEVELTCLSAEGLQEKLTTSIASGQGPDVLELFPSLTAQFWDQGLLENLDGTLSADDEKDYGAYLDILKLRGPDGQLHLHGYPGVFSTVFTAVDKSQFEKLGLADLIPADRDWTFDSFRKALEAIHKADPNAYGYALVAGGQRLAYWHFFQFVEGNGGSWWNEDYTKCALNSPESVQAIEYLQGLVKDGLVPPGGAAMGFGDLYNLWNNKTIAMAPHWQQIWPETAQAVKEGAAQEPFDIIATTWPHAPGVEPTHFVDVLDTVVFKQTDDAKRQAAIDLAQLFTSTDQQFEQSKATLQFPTRQSAAKQNPFAGDKEMEWVTYYVTNTPPHREGVSRPGFPEIRAALLPIIQSAINLELPAKDAMDQACAAMDKIIAEKK